MRDGDLRDWATETDTYSHDVTGKILLPAYWSPIQEVDFARVPTDGAEHELSLFMEDTGWPSSSLDDYIKMWDELYYQPLVARAEGRGAVTIDVQQSIGSSDALRTGTYSKTFTFTLSTTTP